MCESLSALNLLEINLGDNQLNTKKALDNITSNQGVYTPDDNQNDSWSWEVNKKQESLDWLLG